MSGDSYRGSWLLCWLLGHNWDEEFMARTQELAKTVQPLYVTGGGLMKPCKRCARWTYGL